VCWGHFAAFLFFIFTYICEIEEFILAQLLTPRKDIISLNKFFRSGADG